MATDGDPDFDLQAQVTQGGFVRRPIHSSTPSSTNPDGSLVMGDDGSSLPAPTPLTPGLASGVAVLGIEDWTEKLVKAAYRRC